jgi:hypothetical protein
LILHPCVEAVAERLQRIDKALRSGTLVGKDAGALLNDYTYPAGGNKLGLARAGAAEPDNSKDFRDEYTIPFVVSVFEEDRDGDVVVPLGCQLGNYEKNPVWFFGHQENPIPIGTARSVGRDLMVWPEENRIRAACRFDEHDEDAMFIHDKVLRGFLNATSMAFVPIEAYRREEVEKARVHGGTGVAPTGWLFKRYDLTEISVVGVPSNAGAIRDVLDSEKGLSPRIKKALKPYAAESKGCWGGWCPCPDIPTSPRKSLGVVEKGTPPTKSDVQALVNRARGQFKLRSIKVEDAHRPDLVRVYISSKVVPAGVVADWLLEQGLQVSNRSNTSDGTVFLHVTVSPSKGKKSLAPDEQQWRAEVQRLLERELGRGALELVPPDVLSGWYKERRSAAEAARLAEADFHGGTGRRTGKLDKSPSGAVGKTMDRNLLNQLAASRDWGQYADYLEDNGITVGGKIVTAYGPATVLSIRGRNRSSGYVRVKLENPPTGMPNNEIDLFKDDVAGLRSKGVHTSSQEKRGSTPLAANVRDFEVGDRVVARTQLTWINPDTKKSEVFCRVGDRLDVVGTSGSGRVQCKRRDGAVSEFGSTEVRRVSKSLHTSPQKKSKSCGCNACKDKKPCLCAKGTQKVPPVPSRRKADVPPGGGPVPKNETNAFGRWKVVRDNNGWWCEDSLHPGAGAGPFDSRQEAQRRCEELNARHKSVGKELEPGNRVLVGLKYTWNGRQFSTPGGGGKGVITYRHRTRDGVEMAAVEMDNGRIISAIPLSDLKADAGKGPKKKGLRKVEEYKGYVLKYNPEQGVWVIFDPSGKRLGNSDKAYWKVLVDDDINAKKGGKRKGLNEGSGGAGGYTVPPGSASGEDEDDNEGTLMKTRVRVSAKNLLKAVEKLKRAGVACKGSMTHTSKGMVAFIDAGCDLRRAKGLLGAMVLKVRDYGDQVENDEYADTGDAEKPNPSGDYGDQVENDEYADTGDVQKSDEGEGKEEESPPEPLPSAKVIAGLHGHAKSESDYLQDELSKMDHPQVKEALEQYHEDHVVPRMEHLEGLLGEHHPDHDMESCMKALEQGAGSDGGMETGEEGKVEGGEVPEEEPVEEGKVEGGEVPEEEPVENKAEAQPGVGDRDGEEILERYQTRSGRWLTRVVGTVRVAKDGRKYLTKKLTSGEAQSLVAKLNQELGLTCTAVYGPGAMYRLKGIPTGGVPGVLAWLKGKGGVVERAYASGSDVYFKSLKKGYGEEDEEKCSGTYKGLEQVPEEEVGEYGKAVGEAGELMGDMGEDDEVPKRYKGALRHHAKRLGTVSKALTSMGKFQRNGGTGSTLTDEGTLGNKGSMNDKGEVQRNGGAAKSGTDLEKELANRLEMFERKFQLWGGGVN